MTVLTSRYDITDGRPAPPGKEGHMANQNELVTVITNPDRPLQGVKMRRNSAEAYLRTHPDAAILGVGPETKMVANDEPAIEDKMVAGPKATKKAAK